MTEDSRKRLDACVDAIESGYEYFLAYAAQGRRTDVDNGASTSQVRTHLQAMIEAMDQLDDAVRQCAAQKNSAALEAGADFIDAISADAARAAGALKLVSAQADISSQLIDNLNASIHVRTLLTDLFIVDEAFR